MISNTDKILKLSMVDSVQFDIQGVEALSAKLKVISDDLKFKGGRFALRKAANLVRDAAKKNSAKLDDPKTAANIEKNIAVRWSNRTFKRTGNLVFRVGVLGGARSYANTTQNRRQRRVGKTYLTDGASGNPGGDTFHWRFLEFGTSRSRAQPFMRRSLSENINQATAEFVNQYDKALVRALKRAENAAKGKK